MGRIIKFEDFQMEDDMPNGNKIEQVIGGTPDNPSGCCPQSMQKEMAGPVDDDCESAEEDDVNAEQDDADLEEAKLTNKTQEYVSTKIAQLKKEGYDADQAAAIAFSMARKRGFDVDESMIQEDEEVDELDFKAYVDTVHDFQELHGVQVKNINTDTVGYINDDNISNWDKVGHSVFVASEPDGDRGNYHDIEDLVVIMGKTDEAETSHEKYSEIGTPVKPHDEEKIKKYIRSMGCILPTTNKA